MKTARSAMGNCKAGKKREGRAKCARETPTFLCVPWLAILHDAKSTRSHNRYQFCMSAAGTSVMHGRRRSSQTLAGSKKNHKLLPHKGTGPSVHVIYRFGRDVPNDNPRPRLRPGITFYNFGTFIDAETVTFSISQRSSKV